MSGTKISTNNLEMCQYQDPKSSKEKNQELRERSAHAVFTHPSHHSGFWDAKEISGAVLGEVDHYLSNQLSGLIQFIVNDDVPIDEIHFIQDGKIVGKITGIGS